MRKDTLWKAIIDKNPRFLAGNITLTSNGLKKLFDLAFDEGHKQGAEDAEQSNPLACIFGRESR